MPGSDLEPIKAAVVSASLDGVIVVDEEGRVLGFNPAAEAMFGYSADEALGRPIADLIVPDRLREAHLKGFAAYVAGGPPKVIGKRVELFAKTKAGGEMPVELSILEVTLGGRRVFTATIRDRSDHAAEAEELQQTRRQLELAVVGAQIGVWTYDPRSGVSWYSDRVKEIVGFENNFMADGEEFRSRVHPDDRTQLVFDRTEGFPEGRVASEYRIVRPDGTVRWLYSLGAAARDEAGEVEAVHGVIIDVTERKKSEEELERTRRQLELAVHGAQLGAWSFDPKTGSCWFSDRSRDLLCLADNYMPDARGLKAVVHPDDWPTLAAPYYDRYPDEPLPLEFRVVKPDGGIRWISALGAAVRDGGGDFLAVHGIHSDVTERKLAEGELDDSRRRLELAVEGAKLGTWTYDLRTGATWYSDRSKQMYGLPAETEMSTDRIRASVHPDDWEEVSEPYLTGFKQDKVEVEYRVVCPDGSVRWIYSLGAAARDAEGRGLTVNGIHLDITDRKQAEEELAETRRQLELAVDGAKIGSWTVDPQTGATWYSDRSRALHGLDHELRLDARMLKSYVHPDDWDLVLDSYRKGFPGDAVELEHRVVWPSGEVRWVQSLGTALRDENGRVRLVSGIHVDITDRKRAEEELARSREALNQSEKLAAMGALLAGVSHELNNPLAAIVGQAEMLEEDGAGTAFETRAKKIKAAAERCARIVQTFLAMARQKERQSEQIDVNALVSSALEITEYGLRTAGIAVKVSVGSNLPAVNGDRDQLHQVVVNLIVNAKQAMEGGEAFEKVLTVRTSVDQAGMVLIDVADSGPGITAALKGRIFDPFFTTKPQGSGTGMGLSFSLGIVEAHGGRLTLEPSRRGALFRVALPAVPQDEIVAVPVRPDAPTAGSGGRALIVEDEADVAETLRELLEREGYRVTAASDGAAALMALEWDEFDVIISDLRMPGISGPELHARLSETKPHLLQRMAFVTGDTLGSSMDAFLRGCGRPVLEKPFTKVGVRCLIAALAQPRPEP